MRVISCARARDDPNQRPTHGHEMTATKRSPQNQRSHWSVNKFIGYDHVAAAGNGEDVLGRIISWVGLRRGHEC